MFSTGSILVIDDDDASREFVGVILSCRGYHVIAVPHGAAALDILDQVQPDVILLNLYMPVMDGWAFAQAYRNRSGPHAPIILLTAAPDATRYAAQVGAAGVLVKPFDLDELVEIVDRHAGSGAAAPLLAFHDPQTDLHGL